MKKVEVRQIEHLLFHLSRSQKSLNCLEWGSGGSTVHFTRWMKSRRIEYSWTSLEHHPHWFTKVQQKLAGDRRVRVLLFSFHGESAMEIRSNVGVSVNEYVSYPARFQERFDFVLVDGRYRRRCLIACSKALSARGVAVLHDASRQYYHCAFPVFPYGRFISKDLWVGSMLSPLVSESD